MRTLLLPLLLVCTTLCAQVDSTAKAHERLWLGNVPSDGRMSHELPPPMNLVNAGGFMIYTGQNHANAWWLRLIGGAAGAILYTQNEAAGLIVGGGAMAYSIRIDLRAARYERNTGVLLQSGYRIENKYELVPDSIGQEPPMRMVPKNWKP